MGSETLIWAQRHQYRYLLASHMTDLLLHDWLSNFGEEYTNSGWSNIENIGRRNCHIGRGVSGVQYSFSESNICYIGRLAIH